MVVEDRDLEGCCYSPRPVLLVWRAQRLLFQMKFGIATSLWSEPVELLPHWLFVLMSRGFRRPA